MGDTEPDTTTNHKNRVVQGAAQKMRLVPKQSGRPNRMDTQMNDDDDGNAQRTTESTPSTNVVAECLRPMLDFLVFSCLLVFPFLALLLMIFPCGRHKEHNDNQQQEQQNDNDEDEADECTDRLQAQLIGLLFLTLFGALFWFRSYQKLSKRIITTTSPTTTTTTTTSDTTVALTTTTQDKDNETGATTTSVVPSFRHCLLHTAAELGIYLPGMCAMVFLGFSLQDKLHSDYVPSMPQDFMLVLPQVWIAGAVLFRLSSQVPAIQERFKTNLILLPMPDLMLVTVHTTALMVFLEGMVRLWHHAWNSHPWTVLLWIPVGMGGAAVGSRECSICGSACCGTRWWYASAPAQEEEEEEEDADATTGTTIQTTTPTTTAAYAPPVTAAPTTAV